MQVSPAALFGFEHDPISPANNVGPSTCWFDPGWVNMVDGVTVKRATWPWSIAAGARYANSMRNIAVSIRTGVR